MRVQACAGAAGTVRQKEVWAPSQPARRVTGPRAKAQSAGQQRHARAAMQVRLGVGWVVYVNGNNNRMLAGN